MQNALSDKSSKFKSPLLSSHLVPSISCWGKPFRRRSLMFKSVPTVIINYNPAGVNPRGLRPSPRRTASQKIRFIILSCKKQCLVTLLLKWIERSMCSTVEERREAPVFQHKMRALREQVLSHHNFRIACALIFSSKSLKHSTGSYNQQERSNIRKLNNANF